MSMNTPIGNITQTTTPIKDFKELEEMQIEQYLLGIDSNVVGNGSKISLENLINSSISTDNGNVLEQGIDGKLYVETPENITGDLSDLSTTDKSSLVSAINEIFSNIRASKGYIDEGELLTDSEGLADVKNYAHSTFDLSKFTVVGSPVITDDGIASGFSASNYVTAPLTINPTNTYKIYLDIPFDSDISSGSGYYFRLENSVIELYNATDGTVQLYYRKSDGTKSRLFSMNKVANTTFNVFVEFNLANLSVLIGYKKSNETNYTINTFTISNYYTLTNNINIGPNLFGSIDLKQFSITVNGVEVFSGNKTGIDTIKPDNYTVVGTPTISADGIASGFSGSDYLTTLTFNPSTKAWTIINSFTTGASVTGSNQHFLGTSANSVSAKINTNGHPVVYLSSNGTSDDIGTITGTYTFLANTKYYVKIDFTGSKYILSYSLDGKTYTETGTAITSSTAVYANSTLYIGKTSTGYPFDGSIDLNAFKIYVDGNIKWQACLKIPYTESKTGSKIVDSFYRDRVSSVYEQYGSAPYYTLDEVNNNFTLPMGELYGFIEKAKGNLSVPAYGNQHIGVTIPSDTFTYTCPDDGYIYCNNIQVSIGGGFELSILRNGQSSLLISFGGSSVDSSVQIPFIYPVKNGDIVQTLLSTVSETYPILYFVPKEGV